MIKVLIALRAGPCCNIPVRDAVYLIYRGRRKSKLGNTGKFQCYVYELILLLLLYASYSPSEVRQCVFDCCVGRENVVVVRPPAAVHQPHTHFIFILFFHTFTFQLLGQAVVTGVVPSSPRFLPSIFIAHRVQQSHCSSIFHPVLLTHALRFP